MLDQVGIVDLTGDAVYFGDNFRLPFDASKGFTHGDFTKSTGLLLRVVFANSIFLVLGPGFRFWHFELCSIYRSSWRASCKLNRLLAIVQLTRPKFGEANLQKLGETDEKFTKNSRNFMNTRERSSIFGKVAKTCENSRKARKRNRTEASLVSRK